MKQLNSKNRSILLTALLWLWQLPQEMLGYVMSQIWEKRLKLINNTELPKTLSTEEFPGRKIFIAAHTSKMEDSFLRIISGFSIGRYICLTDLADIETVRHENGHCVQSERLGWLYLPVIGIYSAVFCNLWDRWFHKNWKQYDRLYWYYKLRWTELNADKCGKVARDIWLAKRYPQDGGTRYLKP